MDELEFIPAPPGSWSNTTRYLSLLNEESAHATVAALMGVEIKEARIDPPAVDANGHVLITSLGTAPVNSEQDIRYACYGRLLAALAGPLFVGCWESARWPLDEKAPGDEALVARYCRRLDFDAVDLLMAEACAATLLKHEPVERALWAVRWALLEHGVVPGHRVEEIVTEMDADPAVVRRARWALGESERQVRIGRLGV
jgi:hypothetical protein